MKINQIWEEMEDDQSFLHGLLLRRYTGSIMPDVFVALKAPERLRCIAASVGKEIKVDIVPFSNLRDIKVELIPDQTNSQKNILLFELLNSQYKDIFSALCEDLIISIEKLTSESDLIEEIFNRFEKWISLFEVAGLHGLTQEEQRGLFGELLLLRKMLHEDDRFTSVLASWVGCEGQVRDFQYNIWGIEVKTTFGNNHQKLHISSERQLDCSSLEYLFLYHLSLEARQKSGYTLNDLVDSIRELLKGGFRALNNFNAKLIEGKYFDHHRTLYDDIGYVTRHELFYRVQGDFPRIEEQDIRNGVGDVKYSIIVSQASQYALTEQEVFKALNFDE